MLSEDRRRTVREISDSVKLKKTVVHQIMKESLNLSKVSARWVPRILSAEEKDARVTASKEFIRRYEREGDRFLGRIVTTDETYVSLYEPESKFESMVWKQPSSQPLLKAKRCRSTKRYMFIFFMDSEGILLQHAVPKETTVNAAYYQKVSKQIVDFHNSADDTHKPIFLINRNKILVSAQLNRFPSTFRIRQCFKKARFPNFLV